MNLYSTLKQLCLTPSVSGRESNVREIVRKRILPYADSVSVDPLGNLIAYRKGSTGERRIMLCAHMDEIGFMVNYIEENGYIRVAAIGGVNMIAASYSKVISERGCVGVLVPEDNTKAEDIKPDSVYIDIGASCRRDAERKVMIGDFFVVAPELYRLVGKRVAGRPLDDRVGCVALLALAERLADAEPEADIYFVFSVQEEVGCRGSVPATFGIEPTESICIDVTRTGDAQGAKPMVCILGKGVAVKIKDSSVICHEKVVNSLLGIAKASRIPVQREILVSGGTDTSSMQLTAGGSMAGALSIPTRYIHTGVETCDMRDIEACVELAEKYILTRG